MTIKVLSFTSLYPNEHQPRFGIFVEQRLLQLIDSQDVQVRVVAPVEWFPGARMVSRYRVASLIKKQESRNGIQIVHPRYLSMPKFGVNMVPWMMARSCLPLLKKIKQEFDFQLIDAHYLYPDGVAAIMLAEKLNVPVVMTARGSDVNVLPNFPRLRKQILWATQQANAIITVANALKVKLAELGVEKEKVTVLRNGVDAQRFYPMDKQAVRSELDISGPTLLSVGNLIELKGHHLIIDALKELPGFKLIIIGEGEMRDQLQKQINAADLQDRVRLQGMVEQEELQRFYSAADALVLASSREGWANVLLESMACGTPVVATSVSGNPEVVQSRTGGILVKQRTAQGLADGVRQLFAHYPKREETRYYAQGFSWQQTSQGQMDLFSHIIQGKIHPVID